MVSGRIKINGSVVDLDGNYLRSIVSFKAKSGSLLGKRYFQECGTTPLNLRASLTPRLVS